MMSGAMSSDFFSKICQFGSSRYVCQRSSNPIPGFVGEAKLLACRRVLGLVGLVYDQMHPFAGLFIRLDALHRGAE